MASTVLVKDVLWRAAVLLQDTTPQFHRNTEQELVDWLNDGYVAITTLLPSACSRLDAIKLAPGTRQSIRAIPAANCKPGDGSTPTEPIYGNQLLDAVCNMGADGLSPGRAVRMVSRRMLDSQNRNWHTTTASVISAVTFDPAYPGYFFVSPGVPASPAVWMLAAFTAQPVKTPNTGTAGSELYLKGGASTAVISIADENGPDLVNYIAARAHMKEVDWAEPAKVAAFTAAFTGSLNARVMAQTGHNPNLKRLPMAPVPIGAAS